MSTLSRLAWLDVGRWVALMAMFVAHVAHVAHVAPSAGPLNPLLNLGDYLAVALFATTMGASAQLAAEAYAPLGDRRRLAGWLVGALVRGALLIALGALTEIFDAYLVGVLMHLGALAVVAAVVVLLPTVWVAGTAVVALVVSPWVQGQLSPLRAAAIVDQEWLARALEVVGGGHYYRLPTLLVWACAGALVVRWWRSPSFSTGRSGSGAVVCGVVSVVPLGLHATGVMDVPPYSGSHVQISLSALLSVVVLLAALVLVGPDARWAAPLATAGSMALTLYVAQHAFLGWWVRNGANDDSWITLAVLTVGGTALAVAWQRVHWPPVLRRGLLDGPVSWVSARARDAVGSAHRAPT